MSEVKEVKVEEKEEEKLVKLVAEILVKRVNIKVVAPIVLSLVGLGGTSPWWYNDFVTANNKPEQPRIESGEVSGPTPASGENLARTDRPEPENRYGERDGKWADSRRRGDRPRGRWRDRRSWGRERDREEGYSRWRGSRSERRGDSRSERWRDSRSE